MACKEPYCLAKECSNAPPKTNLTGLGAQLVALDFTGGGLGELGDELYDLRALIARQALAHEGAHYFISFVSGGALGVACGRAGAGATSPARWD